MRILLAEDDRETGLYVSSFLRQIGHFVVVAEDGLEALNYFKSQLFDLVITDDIMPKMTGMELLRKIITFKPERDFDVLVVTGYGNINAATESIKIGAHDYLLKPIDIKVLINAIKHLAELQNKRRNRQKMEQGTERANFLSTLELTINALDLRDNYTYKHSEAVSGLCGKICSAMGLNHGYTEAVYFAAKLHDIGKIGVPDSILNKSGRLTTEEYEKIKLHPVSGSELINTHEALSSLALMVRHHHEHYDGSGYPDGLKDDQIPLGARIISVADGFDAMFTDRPYRRAMPFSTVVQTLVNDSGTKFDPYVVKVFINVLNKS